MSKPSSTHASTRNSRVAKNGFEPAEDDHPRAATSVAGRAVVEEPFYTAPVVDTSSTIAGDGPLPAHDGCRYQNSGSLSFARGCIRCLDYTKYGILFTWIVMMAGFAVNAASLPQLVTQDIPPPKGSAAAIARELYREKFPSSMITGFIVFSETRPFPFDLAQDEQYLLYDQALDWWCRTGDLNAIKPSDPSTFVPPEKATTKCASYSSFRTSGALNLPSGVTLQYLSPGNFSTFSSIAWDALDTSESAKQFTKDLSRVIPILHGMFNLSGRVESTPLSLPDFVKELDESTSQDLTVTFAVVVPLSLAIFGISTRSLRFVLLPLQSFISTIILTWGILASIARATNVNSLSLGMSGALCLALCFNYTFLMCRRFQRELVDLYYLGPDCRHAVLQLVMGYSGRMVLISSVSIMAATMGLVFFPLDLFRGVGLSVVCGAFSAMFTNLILIPTSLLMFYDFYVNGVKDFKWPLFDELHDQYLRRQQQSDEEPLMVPPPTLEVERESMRKETLPALEPLPDDVAPTDPNFGRERQPSRPEPVVTSTLSVTPQRTSSKATGSFTPAQLMVHSFRERLDTEAEANRINQSFGPATNSLIREHQQRKFYRSFAHFVCQKPVAFACVFVCLVAAIFPMIYAFDTTYSAEESQFIPRNAKILGPWGRIKKVFRAGEVYQGTLLIKFNKAKRSGDDIVFTQGHEIIYRMAALLPETPLRTFDTVFFDGVDLGGEGGGNVSATVVNTCFGDALSGKNLTSLCSYRVIQKFIFSPAAEPLVYVMVRTIFDPMSKVGLEWYKKAKNEVWPALEKELDVQFWFTSHSADSIETLEFAERHWPLVVGLVALILLIIAIAAFLSLGLPLRSLFVIFISSGCCFGFANLVFNHGILSFLPLASLQAEDGSISWLTPYAVLLIVIGICMHYELSVTITVLQFYHHGFATNDAIGYAASETTSDINVAALMMIVIFSGLLLSEIPVMNELGFFFLMAALIQGIVSRLFLSTTLMALLGEFNFWPYCSLRKIFATATPPLLIADDPTVYDEILELHDSVSHHQQSRLTRNTSLAGFANSKLARTENRSANELHLDGTNTRGSRRAMDGDQGDSPLHSNPGFQNQE